MDMSRGSKIDFNGIIALGLERGLSLDETMHLAFINDMFGSLHLDVRMKIVVALQERGLVILHKEDNTLDITTKGKAVFRVVKRDNNTLAKTLRDLFPSGLKDDKWSWRATNVLIRDKLDRFNQIYPEATDDQIVNATKNYLNKMRDNERGMSLLQYFILKNTDDGQKSILAEYIDVEEDLKKAGSSSNSNNIMQI